MGRIGKWKKTFEGVNIERWQHPKRGMIELRRELADYWVWIENKGSPSGSYEHLFHTYEDAHNSAMETMRRMK